MLWCHHCVTVQHTHPRRARTTITQYARIDTFDEVRYLMAGYSRPAVARIFGVPALGGLLFGWDIGATSCVDAASVRGVQRRELERRRRGLSFLQGLITSGGVAGALIGAAIVFRVADAIGRRRELILAALLYIAGALRWRSPPGASGRLKPSGLALLLLGRLVYGAACGFAMRVPGVRRGRLHAIAETSRRHRSPTHTGTARRVHRRDVARVHTRDARQPEGGGYCPRHLPGLRRDTPTRRSTAAGAGPTAGPCQCRSSSSWEPSRCRPPHAGSR